MQKKTIIIICIITVILSISSLIPSFAAEPVLITAEGEYVMGAGETMEVAEERAKKAAMQSAAEKAGAFVKSYTKVKNLSLESDVIEVIANHSMKVRVLEKKKTPVGDLDAIRFYVKIEAKMTEEEIEANLDRVRKDQSIADAYHRLKADYENKDREMEKLKRQLELATGGDRQRIAKLITEEEKKYKANLWLERGQSLGFFQSDEALKAYRKALELNPGLAQAYAGIAEVLHSKNLGEPEDPKGLEKKTLELREALANIDRAISLEDNIAYAYALRANLLRELMDTEVKLEYAENKETSEEELSKKKWQYYEKILPDLNRAIALQAPNRAELYYWRSGIYQERAWQYKDDRNFEQALADIDQAIVLRKEGDMHTLSGYWRVKANIYINAETYYRYHGQDEKASEMRKLSDRCYKKVVEIVKKEQAESNLNSEKEEAEIEAFYQTDFGKLYYDLMEGGWEERVLGIDRRSIRRSLERMSDAEKKKLEEQFEAKRRMIEQKVASGNATAEEYLWAGNRANDMPRAETLIATGLSLLEKRNPRGRDALFLVSQYHGKAYGYYTHKQYDAALNILTKARAMVDANLARALKLLSMEDFWRMFSLLTKKEETPGRIETQINMVKSLDRKQSEACHWIQYGLMISHLKAQIYEKLDLSSQARREYQYLCEELKDDKACKDAERLR